MNRKVLIIIVVAIAVFAAFKFRPRDIRADISRVEEAVLLVLQSRGVTGKDFLFREENEWRKSGVKGKTLNYVVKLKRAAKTSELTEEIREKLKHVKGFDLAEVYYRSETKGPGGTAYFEVAYKGNAILALTLENALPG
ncbi:MAG: hypothetical protein ACE5JK_04550, partial [Candidatus Omnitrophota bacterium]